MGSEHTPKSLADIEVVPQSYHEQMGIVVDDVVWGQWHPRMAPRQTLCNFQSTPRFRDDVPCRPCPIGEDGKTDDERAIEVLSEAIDRIVDVATKMDARIAELEAAIECAASDLRYYDSTDTGIKVNRAPRLSETRKRLLKALAGGEVE